ncbi:MAG: glutamate-1-semialdehyde 2,1-aminomutase [Ignavibacteriaceae bacterium]|nr:glutamate-1-semialdehyde 2,1-aminomutase [Ignavibacteriaceae bacterium]
MFEKSIKLFQEAEKYIPGGVNSPVRAFKSVGGNPVFMVRGNGSKMYDADGNEYVDFIGSWGPHLLGHNHPVITSAISEKLKFATSFGAPTEDEINMAKLINGLVPSVEMVRMVNSGTEACMAAVRVARGFTGREKIIKFEGCYHGHADFFLIKAGSGALTLGVPNSPGVTVSNANDTLVARYNDIKSVESLVFANKGQVAAIIVEPVVGNMGCVIPKPGFLEDLRELCTKEGIILIFDEVMTGFRLSKGGAQELFRIKPDLSTFGKIIGGGLPVGAFGGRADIMRKLAPLGPVYQAGTLSGNPLAMAAGSAMLNYIIDNPGLYSELEAKTKKIQDEFEKVNKSFGKDYTINRIGSMISLFFTSEPVSDFESAVTSDTNLFGKYFHEMLKRGIYLPPAQFESWFISTAISDMDIEKTVKAHEESLKAIL